MKQNSPTMEHTSMITRLVGNKFLEEKILSLILMFKILLDCDKGKFYSCIYERLFSCFTTEITYRYALKKTDSVFWKNVKFRNNYNAALSMKQVLQDGCHGDHTVLKSTCQITTLDLGWILNIPIKIQWNSSSGTWV